MDEEVVTVNTIENEVSSRISSLINSQDGWSEDDKLRVHCKYMKEYGEVLREMVPLIQHIIRKPINEQPQLSEQEGGSKEEDKAVEVKDCESLEDIGIRHEGTLIAVTKKRKEYPAQAAILMGKTVRLQKNTVEALKVALPPKAPLEIGEEAEQLDERIKCLVEESVPVLIQSSQSIQQHTHRLSHLAQAAQVIFNNQHHPIDALLAKFSYPTAP